MMRTEENMKDVTERMRQRRGRKMQADRVEISGEVPTEMAGVDSPVEASGHAAELAEVKKESAENYDRYLRLAAEFENYKKRTQKERTDLLNYGNESIIKEILPTLDSLDRALEHTEAGDDLTAFVEGLKLIRETLFSALQKRGVEKIEAVGKPFDPNYHEALMQVEAGESPENTVVDEYEKGYLLNGRLLRPSRVSVAKNSGKQ